jgi:hypothetical protein
MPKKTITFEQFMHAVNNHNTMHNHSKNVRKRGAIAKGDYQTGLFGGGQSPAAQAAAQAAAQKAAQRAAEQAQRRADAQANQRAAQARAPQPTAQPAAQPAGNGAAQAVAAQATRPVYSAPTGNGAAAAAQLGATTDPEARRKARLQREALAQRQAAQRAAAAQAMTSPTAQPTAQPNTFSSLLNSAGNAIVNAFPPRKAYAAPPAPIGTVIPVEPPPPPPPPPPPTAQPTNPAQPTGTVGATAQPTAQPTEAPWTAVPTQAPVYTQTQAPIVATSAPPTLTNTVIPSATPFGGSTDTAEATMQAIMSNPNSGNYDANMAQILAYLGYKQPIGIKPTAIRSSYSFTPNQLADQGLGYVPPYIPLLNTKASNDLASQVATYQSLGNPGNTVPPYFDPYLAALGDVNPNSPRSRYERGVDANGLPSVGADGKALGGRPAWSTSGMELDGTIVAGINTDADKAIPTLIAAKQIAQVSYNGAAQAAQQQMERYFITKDPIPVQTAIADLTTARNNLILARERADAAQAIKNKSAANIATLQDKSSDKDLREEAYNLRYPKEATPGIPTEIPTVAISTPSGGGGDGGVVRSGNGNTTVTQSTPTATATNTPIAISQQEMDRLRRLGALTPEAEMGNRYIVGAGKPVTDSYGLAPYQQGQPGAFNPYDVGSFPPNYVQNRVMGNIVPASYRSPTSSLSPTATTQRTQTPTPSNQARTTPTQGMPSGMITPSRTRTPTQQAIPTQTQTVIPQQAPPSPGGNAAPAFGRGLGVGGGAGAMMQQSELVRAIQQLMGNQQTAQQQAISAYPQFATTQKRQKGKLKKDIGVGTGLTAHATQPVAESPMPRVHTSYGNYKFKKPSQENRSAKYGESQQLQQPVRKQIDAMQPMQPRQTMTNPMQYPPSRAPQNVLNPMPLDSNESMMFKKYMGSPAEQPVQSTDKYIPSHMQRNKQR